MAQRQGGKSKKGANRDQGILDAMNATRWTPLDR